MRTFRFPVGQAAIADVLEFAETFFGGGTDFQAPLTAAAELLEAEYNTAGRQRGDIVLITDGLCGLTEDWMRAWNEHKAPDGVRATYALDDPAAAQPSCRRRREPASRQATLMIRHVRRDKDQIIRHIVREVRDEQQAQLSYDSKLGECVFRRDSAHHSDPGAGTLHVAPNHSAITDLPEAEQTVVRTMLANITDAYQRHCTFLTGDKLRSVIRRYIEDLGGIRVRPTGGVYFVHRRHADTLAAMRTLVSRFGEGSHLVRIPIPDQDEMRQMIIGAFTTKAKDDLNQLARDVAAAQRDGADQATIGKLYRRFTELQQATADHAELLSTSLDDTNAALLLVNLQLTNLLTHADDDTDEQRDNLRAARV